MSKKPKLEHYRDASLHLERTPQLMGIPPIRTDTKGRITALTGSYHPDSVGSFLQSLYLREKNSANANSKTDPEEADRAKARKEAFLTLWGLLRADALHIILKKQGQSSYVRVAIASCDEAIQAIHRAGFRSTYMVDMPAIIQCATYLNTLFIEAEQ